MARISLPYFDHLFAMLDRGSRELDAALGKHVHWGYWPDPSLAEKTGYDFARAAERLAERMIVSGGVENGQRVLDVGCGFGGLVSSMNDRHTGMNLVGLNIDARQIERARKNVVARGDNTVEFVEGDACKMPFDDASFDVVFAVECAFHFESRAAFIREAHRVLRPGGRLAICDILPSKRGMKILGMKDALFSSYLSRVTGPVNLACTSDDYLAMGRDSGFNIHEVCDITRGTVPTYGVLKALLKKNPVERYVIWWGLSGMEALARLGLLEYVIVTFSRSPEARRSEPVASPVAEVVSA